MNRYLPLLHAACALLLAVPAFAQTTNTNHRGLPGLIFEAEDWSTPRAWLTNQISATKWRLWTTEGKGKRSRDASLTTPKIERDRATPEEGAPPLHTHITGIPRGVYRAWLGGTTRPLAWSLDAGKTWQKSSTGETDLGVHDIKDGTFNLHVDDRYANPASIGSAYYDYIRLVAFVPATLSELAAFTLPDGATQISWLSNEPTPAAIIECEGREFTETESDQRNHRVILTGLPAGKRCEARVQCHGTAPVPVKFVAGQQPRSSRSKPQTIELTISEPTGTPRKNWPVTAGVPFARGALASAKGVALTDAAGKPMPVQLEVTAHWPDGSVKWLQASFCTETAREPVKMHLCTGYNVRPLEFSLQAASRKADRLKPELQPLPATVTIQDAADAVTVTNGPLSLRIGREKFALFDGLSSVGEAKGGNGRILDGNGKAYFVGKPDAVMVEERGPIRAVVRAEGDFVAEDGAKLFCWRARYFVYAGQPWVRLNWTIGNNATNAVLTNLQTAGIRIPFAANGPIRGSFDGGPAGEIKDDHSTWLLQDKDDRFTASVNGQQTNGKQSSGCARAADDSRSIEVVVKDFWQLYPKGIAIKPDGLHVRVLPPLPADAFAKESEKAEDLIRLYYGYDRGQYRVKRGLEFTTDIYVRFGVAPASLAA